MKYILAHDLGTSGNKATLFTENGKMIASEVFSYDTHYFNDTWVEQNAEDWWTAVCQTSKNLLQGGNIDPHDVAVVSFSGQMMGCLCVDEQGNPLRPSIIWADQRAQDQVKQIEAHISQRDFYHIVGHRNTASYGIQKLMWVRDNEPEIYSRTYKTLNAKDFVIFRLTGKFYTDYSDGNSNGCFDLNNFKWSEDILKYAGICALLAIIPEPTIATLNLLLIKFIPSFYCLTGFFLLYIVSRSISTPPSTINLMGCGRFRVESILLNTTISNAPAILPV